MKQLEGKHILLTDDEFSVRLSLAMMLDAAGATVTAAANGAQALKLYALGNYDCVVTDYNMPDVRGDALARAIKAANPGQRVVMVSGFAESVLVNGQLPAFIDALLPKPCRMAELLAAVGPARSAGTEFSTPTVISQ